MLDILFINPNWRLDRSILPTDTTRPPRSFPLEWTQFANWRSTVRLDFLDCYGADLDHSLLTVELERRPSRLIVVSSTPSALFWRCPPLNVRLVTDIVKILRKNCPAATIALYGPHGTNDPKWTIKKTGVDWVFRGEPEEYLVYEMNNIIERKFHLLNYSFNQTHSGEVAPEINFDRLPPCDYSESVNITYDAHAWGKALSLIGEDARCALLESSRGCKFDCGFCLRKNFRRTFRCKPLSKVNVEIENLRKNGINYVFIIDETFGLDWTHGVEVMKMLNSANILFGAQTRPDLLTRDRCLTLKTMGCIYLELGLEAREKTHLEFLGKFARAEQALEITHYVNNYIEQVNFNIMEAENPDMVAASSNVSQKDNEGNSPPALIPYPGTEWGDIILARYRRLGFAKWELAEALFILNSMVFYLPSFLRSVSRRYKVRYIALFLVYWISALHELLPIAKPRRTRFEMNSGAPLHKR